MTPSNPSPRRGRPHPRDEIDAKRIAAGVCRHCGDPVPCHSEFGDQRVGVRHTARSFAAERKRRGY